jgi:hypothetical protein
MRKPRIDTPVGILYAVSVYGQLGEPLTGSRITQRHQESPVHRLDLLLAGAG